MNFVWDNESRGVRTTKRKSPENPQGRNRGAARVERVQKKWDTAPAERIEMPWKKFWSYAFTPVGSANHFLSFISLCFSR